MPSSLSPSQTRYGILIKSPRDRHKGGDVERIASHLAQQLASLSNTSLKPFIFYGMSTLSTGFFSFFTDIKKINEDIKNADCLWLHDCQYFFAIYAYVRTRRAGKPILITQHTDYVANPHILQHALLYLLDRWVTRPMLKGADQVTFSSDSLAETYYQKVAFTKPIQIIPNGIDLETFQPASVLQRRQLRSRFSLRDNQPVVIYAGCFTPQHDMKVIYYLAHLLPEWRFWLIGNGSFKPEQWFLPNVQTFRNYKRPMRAELYQAADFLIAPQATSHFPIGFQEAMATGLPILSSPVTAEGSNFAKSHIETASIDPRSPKETAFLWAETLKAKQSDLPRVDCRHELAHIAQLFWDQAKITTYYAEVLRGLIKN